MWYHHINIETKSTNILTYAPFVINTWSNISVEPYNIFNQNVFNRSAFVQNCTDRCEPPQDWGQLYIDIIWYWQLYIGRALSTDNVLHLTLKVLSNTVQDTMITILKITIYCMHEYTTKCIICVSLTVTNGRIIFT